MQELTEWWNTEGEEDWSWNYQAEEIQGQEGQEGQGLALGSLEGKDAGLSLGGYLGHIKRSEKEEETQREGNLLGLENNVGELSMPGSWFQRDRKGKIVIARKAPRTEPIKVTGEWEVIEGVVDSGAIDNVMKRDCGKHFPIKQTELSRRNDGGYRSASDTFIKNEGERHIKGITEDGIPVDMGVQIAEVVKPLFSVRKMKAYGNLVVFGLDEGDFIINKKTGIRTQIVDTGRDFVMKLRVPAYKDSSKKTVNMVQCYQGNCKDCEHDSVFTKLQKLETFQRQQ
jgi:hypothetical protein